MSEIASLNYTLEQAAQRFGVCYHTFREYIINEVFDVKPPMLLLRNGKTKVTRFFPIRAFDQWCEQLHCVSDKKNVTKLDARRALNMPRKSKKKASQY
jgi:hypothetical protein